MIIKIFLIQLIFLIEFVLPFMNIPNIYNNWFCLDFIKNINIKKPNKYNIGDLPLVIWFKNESLPLSTINICSHHGSKLDSGKINKNGCLVCPYHGLNHNEKLTFGKTVIYQDKLWWSYENNNKPPSIPFYNNKNYKKTYITIDINANILDCIYNTFDVNHPEFIHNNILGFGNNNSPISNLKTYAYKNKLGLFFNYNTNTNFKYLKDNLKKTKNFHIYEYPYTTWSCVSMNNKENLFVNINFLPLSKDKTRWFITLNHNYWKSDLEMKLMEYAGRIIIEQDRNQLNNQAKDSYLKSQWINQVKLTNEEHLEDIRIIIKNNNQGLLSLYPKI